MSVYIDINDVSLSDVVFAAEESCRTLQAATRVSLGEGRKWQGP